jgi:hypothetical protein
MGSIQSVKQGCVSPTGRGVTSTPGVDLNCALPLGRISKKCFTKTGVNPLRAFDEGADEKARNSGVNEYFACYTAVCNFAVRLMMDVIHKLLTKITTNRIYHVQNNALRLIQVKESHKIKINPLNTARSNSER